MCFAVTALYWAGQGMWSFAVRVGDADFEEVAAIRFVSATTGNPYKYVPLLEKSTFYINDNSPSRDQDDDQESDAKAEPKSISLNESISTDTVEFMLESCEYRDEVRYTTASKVYSRVFGAQADGIKYYVGDSTDSIEVINAVDGKAKEPVK